MNTRSRARNGNGGRPMEQEEQSELPPRSRKSKSELPLPHDPANSSSPPTDDRKVKFLELARKSKSELPLPMIQLTPQALRQMIEDASAQAASRAVGQYVAEHELPPQPPRQPGRGHGAGSAPKNNEHGRAGFPLAVAPPRRSPFAAHILAEAIHPGIKIPNISEYDGTKDPQDHLDRFIAKADLLDISDVAYCKIFRTTLAGKAMAWFNQLPIGTIDSFEQLSQRFLHHFAINKRYPKDGLILIHRDSARAREPARLRAKVL
ncbi:UNVERIFIED_CONTAM: hypothetical protein Slati_2713300 [Sesamum latifolium]|uniref:Retrotransposon gag domain-containing protein n=1 Tax=Sesamum latifolium TaxID=2727402 RepID=A0AAW2VY28_9LAMI